MARIILQGSRLQNHSIRTLSGVTFTVPPNEDFTIGSGWTNTDLMLSEIGVSEQDNTAFIRIGNNINQFLFSGETDFISSTGGTIDGDLIILSALTAPQATIGSLISTSISGGTIYSGSTDLSTLITGGGGGSTSPAGSNTDIQFNDSGSFGGASCFTFDKNKR